MRHTSYDPGPQPRRRRAVFILSVFTLLLSLMMPMITLNASDAAAKAAAAQDCEEGFVLDDQSGECVEEQPECSEGQILDPNSGQCVEAQPECGEGQVVDPNSGQCVDDPSQQQPVGVQVEKYDCAPGTDASSASFNDLFNECSPNQNPVQLTHGSDNSQEQGKSTTDYSEWLNEPAGSHYVYEQIPEGYGQPVVYCGVYVPQQSDPSPNSMDIQSGNTISWDLQPGEYLYCWWFNVPEDQGFGTINITKYDCAGYADDPQSASYQDLQDACSEPQSNIGFDLYYNQDLTDQTQSDGSGQAQFAEVPVGEVVVAESLPEGYLFGILFCTYQAVPNGAVPEKVDLQDGYFFSWNMEADYVLDCVWFNFPEDQEYNWIDFYKYECEPGTTSDEEFDYYTANCQQAEGWEFDVQWDGGGSSETTDGGGFAGWSQVPTGQWSATETLPEGYGDPLVWCRYVDYPDEAPYSGDWEPFEAPGGFLEHSFEYDNVRIECYWFNFPTENDYNWIDFYKYECAFDTPTDQDADYYTQECQPREGWEFDVQWDGGGATQSTDGERPRQLVRCPDWRLDRIGNRA